MGPRSDAPKDSKTARIRRSKRGGPSPRPLFLDGGPVVRDPAGDGVVVALAGLLGGSLGRVPALGEPPSHGPRMEGDAEVLTNQFHDSAGTPEVGAEAVCGGFLSQPILHLVFLRGAQEPGPTGCGLGSQRVVAIGSVPGDPLGDGDGVQTEPPGDRDLGVAVENQAERPSPSRFQCGSRSFASHELSLRARASIALLTRGSVRNALRRVGPVRIFFFVRPGLSPSLG